MIVCIGFRERSQQRLRIRIMARPLDPRWQLRRTAAGIGLEHDRCKSKRHCRRGRDRFSDAVGADIAAQRVESGLSEHERRAVINVGSVDPDSRPPLLAENVEPGAIEQILIEPIGELAVVDAAAQRTADIAERQLGMERFLGIPQQETLAEVIERGAFLETEIGRGTEPPDTPDMKSTRSSNVFAWSEPDRERSSSVSTPKEKAAARVPPPENDSASSKSSS